MDAIDPARCPLCGGANACAMACAPACADAAPHACWCAGVAIGADVLRRVPPAAIGRACVCAGCVRAAAAAPPRA